MSFMDKSNKYSDTQKEVEEYIKKRKKEGAYGVVDNMTNGSYSQNSNYYNPNAANGDSYQQNSANAGNGYYQQNNANGESDGYYQQDIANNHCPTYYQQDAVNESSNYYQQNAANQGDYQQDIANKHCPTYYHNDSDNNVYTPQDSGHQQTNYYTNQPKATGIFKNKKMAVFILICFIDVLVTAVMGAKFLCLGFMGVLFFLCGIYMIANRKSVFSANRKKNIPIMLGITFTIMGAISVVAAVINVLHEFGI